MAVQIKLQLWKWIRHTLKEGSWAREKQALCRNPPGTVQERKTEKELENNGGGN
jgi:hypothetical protein